MGKILLIFPPITLNPTLSPALLPPLGILYIASVLKRSGFLVKVIDLALEYEIIKERNKNQSIDLSDELFNLLKREILDFKPRIVGISCLFSLQLKNVFKIAELVKRVNKNTIVCVGGSHATCLPEDMIKNINIDFSIGGEGEETMLELANNIDTKDYAQIKGIVFKTEGEYFCTQSRELNNELDTFPFPAREMLEMEDYFRFGRLQATFKKSSRCLNIITSRGCPGRCIFCSVNVISQHFWRPRSAENVLNEIEYLINEYNIKEIHFEDDNLTFDRIRMQQICKGMIKRKFNIYWSTPNGVAISTLDKQTIELMRESGCYKLNFGIEHGDSEFRTNIIKKSIPSEKIKQLILWCKELKIWTSGFFIFGLPGETKETAQKTIDFAIDSDLDSADFYIAVPYPGTELFKQCRENMFLKENIEWSDFNPDNSLISTPTFSIDDAQSWQKKAYKDFYSNRFIKELSFKSILNRFKYINSFKDFVAVSNFIKVPLNKIFVK